LVYIILGIVVLMAVAAVIAYWQLIVAEGAYLGSRVVALLYNWFAPRYDGVKQFDPASDAVMLAEPIIRHLNSVETFHRNVSTVLDVATGTGRLPLALLLQPAFTGHIIAIDASRNMLNIARDKLNAYANRITWQLADAQRLKFDDDTFEVVTSLEALEFFSNPTLALREMIRVLQPGGLLMVSNRIGPDAWKLPGKTMPTHEFLALLESLGIQHVRREDWLVDYDLLIGIKSAR
jgi:ubiquinone/menaquinone biosynthesis C-methylase UbiE